MDLPTFNWLLSDAGQAVLAQAQAGDLSDSGQLPALTHLRRAATAAQAAAAYETARLRVRAAAKFTHAAAMYFTREALEQASGELIAGYRARRYTDYEQVADLCCGIGGDTLALAQIAHVTAIDRDPLRLAMAAANARTLGLSKRITVQEADIEHTPLPAADAIFFDPARRSAGQRVFSLAEYQPPVRLVAQWRTHTSAIGVKIAPGVADDDLATLAEQLGGVQFEVEFISVDGALKEAVLWLGPLATTRRRATLLHTDAETYTLMRADDPPSVAPLSEPLTYLYEPDAAVIRVHLVAELAVMLGAAQLDSQIAYLTANNSQPTPFARRWQILEWLPFNLKRLRARLRALDAGAVTVKKRGSPLDTDSLARQLSGDGTRPLVVVLTVVQGRPSVLICTGPLAG